jgi:hypothetical protein
VGVRGGEWSICLMFGFFRVLPERLVCVSLESISELKENKFEIILSVNQTGKSMKMEEESLRDSWDKYTHNVNHQRRRERKKLI